MNEDWMNNESFKNMDKNKLNLLMQLAEQASKKNQDEMLSYFLAINAKANSLGITFNDEETDIILNVMKTRMSPNDIKNIEVMRNLTKMISSKK